MICIRRDSAAAAICALLAVSSAAPASAADLLDDSWLRGSLGGGPVRWDGVVFGGQIAYSSLQSNFGNSSSSQIAYILRNTALEDQFAPSSWTTLPNHLTNAKSFGFFLGYNVQYDDLVLGGDIAYNHVSNASATASDTIDRVATLADGTVDDVNISASSAIKLLDYGTFRGRAGWAFGQFLPYAVLGGAVGRFDYTNASTVTVVQTVHNAGTFSYPTQTDSQSNKFGFGYLWGLGMDVAITPNVFLRGEWEYVSFNKVGGTLSTLNTGRVGLGVRF
jgi:outer membrane immunogenic protein